MKKAKGTFRKSPKGNTGLIYIPSSMVIDSAFPLKEGKVVIEVANSHLTIKQEHNRKG